MPDLDSSSFAIADQHTFFLDKNCSDLNYENRENVTPLFEAVKSGSLASAQLIVKQQGDGVLWSHDDKGNTPAHWACLGGHTDILNFFIKHKATIDEPKNDEFGMKPIHWASTNGHVAVVDILIQAGVSVDTVDYRGFTPLIVACQYGHTILACYLIGKGARLQLTDGDGDTALHWAAFKGQAEVMRLLMYSGINPGQRDNYGQTPLHLACVNGNIATIRVLCEQGHVELDLMDKKGRTPLVLAMGRKHEAVVNYLKTEAQHRSNFLPRINILTVIFGPAGNSKSLLLFFLVCCFTWGYPMYIFRGIPETYGSLPNLHIFFITMNVIMWISLYHANSADPGFLPRNIPEYDLAIRQVAQFDEWKKGNNPLRRLCHTCRTVKHPRAKHCRFCNRCVKEFDHHCSYIYNCVGHYNRVSFVVFAVSIAIMGLVSLYFLNFIAHMEGYPLRPDYIVGLFIILFVTGMASFVFCTSMYHASMNITTNERVNKKRYSYLKDSEGRFFNPYDKGLKHNFLEYFHLLSRKEEATDCLGIEIMR